ncbi:FAD-dependent oxidoreductase [bacterium]|nr:MAG: FAD-dependent oxidoreductase [bacterium]
MYDTIIIGAGPAGMTAAIYTARRKLKTLVISKNIGGQMVWSADVENYSGFSVIAGADLTLKFEKHMESLKDDLEIKLDTEVVHIEKNITSFNVTDKFGNVYYAKTIIIAAGKEPKHLGVPGEKELFGKGVAVCATCDAPLYKDKRVAVVGAGNSAMDAIYALSKVAKQVFVMNINEDFSGEEALKDRILNMPNVKLYQNTKVTKIVGDKKVKAIGIATYGKDEEELAVDGVFIEIGYEPSVEFADLVDKNDKNEIKVNGDLATNIPGIFAAGDINDAWGEQIIIAAGEGAKAAMAVSNYLNKIK